MLERYEVEVTWLPENINPHGEIENILDGRDLIEDDRAHLTEGEAKRLAVADEYLHKHAGLIVDIIGFDFKTWREKTGVPRSRWWWYVDELAKV